MAPWVYAVCYVMLFSFSAGQLHAPNVLHHPDLGYALLLPLSKNSGNYSLARHRSFSQKRRLVGGPDASARMALYDDLLTKGYYTTRLWIGTPPEEFALIVDTGSTVTYVPCSSCTQCGTHQDPRFNPEASSTYQPVGCGPHCATCDSNKQQCKYLRRYAEMSTSEGLLGKDLVSFGNVSTLGPERLVFGCETSESGDIYDQKADGIMGLGRGPLSIVDQLVEIKAMTASFSLCYGGMDEGGGAMIMGAIPNPPGMVFTESNFRRSAYYNLGLKQVFVGSTRLPLDENIFDMNFGTVLDSGTTYAYFPDKAFKAFKAVLTQTVKLRQIPGPDSHYPDVCFEGAGSDLSKLSDNFPEVHLKFGDGKTVSLDPENYLFKHLKVPGSYCLGIFASEKDSATLLGGIIVRNMLVTYDRVNQQIGFWRTNCSNLWNNLQAVTSSLPSASPTAAPNSEPENSSSPSSSPTCVSGMVEVAMSLDMTYTEFEDLKSKFVNIMSDELQVDASQVSLINYTRAAGNVTIVFTVHLAATDYHLLNVRAEGVMAKLTHQGAPLKNTIGEYQVLQWIIVPASNRSSDSSRLLVLFVLTVALLLLVSTAMGFLVWWYRCKSRDQKYVSIQQSVEMSDQL